MANRIYASNGGNLDALFFPDSPADTPSVYAKTTLVRSPLVVAVYPHFQVSLSKPLSGLASTSINDEDDQMLRDPEKDSYFGGDLGDDDEMWDLHGPIGKTPPPTEAPAPSNTRASVDVVVRASSVLVDGVEYGLPAGVKSVVLVPPTSAAGEDSLLISLLSGYSLLVRIWRAPRGFSDASFRQQRAVPAHSASPVFRPFVVQWWSLSSAAATGPGCGSGTSPESGFSLSAHPSGLAVVSASPHSLFRIHSCQDTPAGVQLSAHFNVTVDGVILNQCFAHPLNMQDASNHILFLTLTLSTSKRLELSLYSWYAHEPLEGNLDVSVLPLNRSFPFPIWIVPLANNNSFLLICPAEFIIITVNNIWSADYSFSRFEYTGTFPTAYSIPAHAILSADADAIDSDLCDEVLVASSDGVVYSVIVQDNKTLECVPIIRVADSISTFDLRPLGSEYVLTFASDTGGAKKLRVPALYMQDEIKMAYTEAQLEHDYRNWTPVVDAIVVDSVPSRSLVKDTSQELWVLSGMGKRTKLSHISSGYAVRKESPMLDAYRKAQGLFTFSGETSDGTAMFLACCLPLETRILDMRSKVDADVALSSKFTIWCANVDAQYVLQVTPDEVVLSDLKEYRAAELSAVFARSVGKFAVFVCENQNQQRLEISEVAVSEETWLQALSAVSMSFQVSSLSVSETEDTLFIVLGGFGGEVTCWAFQKATRVLHSAFSFNLADLGHGHVIPHDTHFFPEGKLYVGTKCGGYLEIQAKEETGTGGTEIKEETETKEDREMDHTETKEDTEMVHTETKEDTEMVHTETKEDREMDHTETKEDTKMVHTETKEDTKMVHTETTNEDRECRKPKAIDPEKGYKDPRTLSEIRTIQKLQLCSMPLRLIVSQKDASFVVAYARNAWLFNAYESEMPRKIDFGDKVEKPVVSMVERPAHRAPHLGLVFVKEDGLGFGQLFTHPSSVVKQISVGEAAKKLAFLESHGLFVLLTRSKNPLTRLKFADHRSYKMLPTVEFDARSGMQRAEPLFGPDEVPNCCLIWNIVRGDRVSKKLIVGSSNGTAGSLKIIDVSRTLVEGTGVAVVKQTELVCIAQEKPVSCIQQIGAAVLFACGASIFSTSYQVETKRLKPAKHLVTLSSDISYMGVEKGRLLVNSKMDSLLAFKYSEESGDLQESLAVTYKDPTPRSLVNNSALGEKYVAGDKLHSQVVMMDSAGDSLFKLSMIPRAYSARFASLWSRPTEHVITVGVNGEVVSFVPENEGFSTLERRLAETYGLSAAAPFADLRDRLARPFVDKVTGKGFHSLYKPFFDYAANRNHPDIVDCDLEEVSVLTDSGVVL